MHLKVVNRNDANTYRVEIVKSIRDANGKLTKEVIKTIGATPLGERLDKLKMLGSYYMVKLREKNQAFLVLLRNYTDKPIQARLAPQSYKPTPLKDLRALKRIRIGLDESPGSLYDQMGIDRVFPKRYYELQTRAVPLALSRITYQA